MNTVKQISEQGKKKLRKMLKMHGCLQVIANGTGCHPITIKRLDREGWAKTETVDKIETFLRQSA